MAKVTDGEPGEVILEEEESTPPLIHVGRKRGGWVTFPFVTVAILGLTVGSAGWQANIIVFLITKFNFMSIDAAQVSNIVNGSSNFIPIFAAIMADSSFGNFSVIIVSSIISSMGLILFMLTVTVPSLRPLECALNVTGSSSATCEAASALQLAVLYLSITLDNFGWDWGVGICLVANLVALVVLLVGKRYYRRVELERSPYKSLARVVVATFQKRKVSTSPENRTFYHWSSDAVSVQPSSSLSLAVPQALRMDRHIGTKFQVQMMMPCWENALLGKCRMGKCPTVTISIQTLLTGQSHHVCIGHVLTIDGMAASAIVERKRLSTAWSKQLRSSTSSETMSTF
ncbi:hypothetical protein C5167_031418 [Papaver somniferum]|uniref:Uncharacterized protein n=1 Tax=Papaver somniferum TaxID=3469 RepID=A0A4Y7K753_PAPSO|nr:hypothetical protein C5167_031418 [Papaver somniferum]